MSILKELYDGRLKPDEKIIPTDPKYREISNDISRILNQWKTTNDAKVVEDLQKLMDLYAQVHEMELNTAFSYGFRMGAGLMVEVLMGEERLATDISKFEV
ncbi:hypothetical protein IDH44_05330 [Paenibacillus sp. IB182496]|uniref:Uncharacterized protein n=1 Tax=Paenibacillus sabuli TaxID=2772509 RepID=A0A927BPZ9_9BACL|nr:DUF6809 family protein [Paenibacillus sabuli]MBD2844603.1 hypothetical protein [Paenibacillus sabuli]